MALSSPSITVAPFDKGVLNAGISASATTIYVAPIYKTVNGVRTKQGFDTTAGLAIIEYGGEVERVSFESKSVDSTTKVTTLSTCTRGLSVTSTTASFSGGTGKAWPKGAKITVVADASYFQSGVFTNVANTFTANQTISSTNELRFDSSATAIWKDGSGNLSLKDAANATKTLTQLAANSGSDEKVKITSADTTQSYLDDAIAVTSPIAKAVTNPGANETLTLSLSTVPVASGGTGATSQTAYAVLCGGTTSTAAYQSVASVGTSGHVLTSNGAGALPTFQAQATNKSIFLAMGGDIHPVTSSALTFANPQAGLRLAYSLFDTTTQEYAAGHFSIPINWTSGAFSVYPVMYCGAGGTGGVVWGFRFTALNDADVLTAITPGSSATSTDTPTAGAGEFYHIGPAASVTIGNTPTAGDAVACEITRITGDAGDTYNADIGLIGLYITYS